MSSTAATAQALGADVAVFPSPRNDRMLEAGWKVVAERMVDWLDAKFMNASSHDRSTRSPGGLPPEPAIRDYVRPYASEGARTRALARWLHRYNHHRVHTAIGDAPITRVTNLPREHT